MKKKFLMAPAVLAALVLSACGSGFDEGGSEASSTAGSDAALRILIASSGDAEAKAVKEAVSAWSQTSGVEAEVDVASDLVQQLAQGFAGGNPPDVFYASSDQFVSYAQNNSIEPYGDEMSNKDDFYPVLRDTFTYEDKLYCAPKDFSTLALVINNDMWKAAGLTEADYPTTWEQLRDVAKKLTSGDHVGLTMGPEYQRLGVFFAEAGGGLLDRGKPAVDREENVKALDYVKTLFEDGSLKLSNQLGAGWGGEAFGKGMAAMAVEGNWIVGAMSNDFPDIDYSVIELPAGPGGKGTLQYTNCWGMAADSSMKDQARSLIEYLTSSEQQMKFSAAFGVMPSVQSAADEWRKANPKLVAFLDGAEYAQYLPTSPGSTDVLTELNAQLEQLPNVDSSALLKQTQADLEAISK